MARRTRVSNVTVTFVYWGQHDYIIQQKNRVLYSEIVTVPETREPTYEGTVHEESNRVIESYRDSRVWNVS
jgi:hypothetical protein